MKSIRTKFTVSLVSIYLFGLIIIVSFICVMASNTIFNQTLEKSEEMVAKDSEKINGWFNEQISMIKTFGGDLVSVGGMEEFRQMTYTQRKNNEHFTTVYIGFSDDTAIFSDDWQPPDDWKATQRPWYKDAIAANKTVAYTSPYLDATTDQMVVTGSLDIGIVNGMQTVCSVDILIDVLIDIVSKMETPKGGYVFMVDKEGNILTHPEKKYLPTAQAVTSIKDIPTYKPIIESNGADHVKLTDYDGVVRYILPNQVSAVGWTIYVSIPESTIWEPMQLMLMYVLPITAVVILLLIFFIWFVVNKIVVKPIIRLKEAADCLAEGKLDLNLATNSIDEIGMLSNDFAKVVDILNTVLNEMKNMAAKHSQGEYDFALDDSKFEGAYKEVATGVNKMTKMYIDNFVEIITVLESFSKGDFNAPIRQYPGKQAVGNQIIESLRSNLKNVNREINLLSKEAAEGRLSARANTTAFEGDWATILINLNVLVESIAVPIQEASQVLTEISKGNLKAKMSGEYKGDFLKIEAAMNTTTAELSSYIAEIGETLSRISENDLSCEIKREYMGDFISIRNSINMIIGTLNRVLRDISDVTESVNQGAKHVSNSGMRLSEGANEQMEAVAELTRNVTLINEQTQKTAKSSRIADQLSTKSMENAQEGNNEMTQMLQSMDGIKEASNNIAKIIKVIDDIAFQTNILALNAAVEAARAGQYGKGFAVVAEEVRSLASRSQNAAKETSDYIEDAIEKISNGTKLANTTSEALNKIVGNVTEVSKLITDISTASIEQAQSVSQVSEGIVRISSVVENTSAISEDNSAAAEELSSQSSILSNLVSVFKLNN